MNPQLGDDWVSAEAMARVEERERIARDLHDVVVQSLLGIGLRLVRMATAIEEPDLRTKLFAAADDLDGTIAETRNYILATRPRENAQRTFVDAAERVAREAGQSFGLLVRLKLDRQLATRLSPVASELLKIIREALSNAARHGRARQCTVMLAECGGYALLSVQDDGSGFDRALTTFGDGIANMQERAASLRGSLEVTSAAGAGTTIEVKLPAPGSADL